MTNISIDQRDQTIENPAVVLVDDGGEDEASEYLFAHNQACLDYKWISLLAIAAILFLGFGLHANYVGGLADGISIWLVREGGTIAISAAREEHDHEHI
jgi:hypothetical protein